VARIRGTLGPMEVFLLVFGVLLIGALAAAMVWQERHPPPEPRDAVVYGVEDSVVYVWEGLNQEFRGRITRSDVRRILEWELHFLQQPALRGEEEPAVVGSVEAAAYVQDHAHQAGHTYDPDVIFAVLDLQAEYLAAIGAIADVAESTEEPPR